MTNIKYLAVARHMQQMRETKEKFKEEMMQRGNPNSKEGIKYVQGTGVKEK